MWEAQRQDGAGCFWELKEAIVAQEGSEGRWAEEAGGLGFCPGDSGKPSAFRLAGSMIRFQF